MSNIFDLDGNWYKGNLHMHTTLSDGEKTPQEAIEIYRKEGYNFIALTDHWVQSENKSNGDMLLLSGCEWDTVNLNNSVFHIIGAGMNVKVPIERSQKLMPQEIIDAVDAAGGIAILAHPAWSVTDPADCMALKGLGGAEIFNSISELPWNGRRADSSLYFDLCATRGKMLRCMAADDSHSYTGEQTHSFIMVKSKELSAASIKQALRNGDFYASQGPLFKSVKIKKNTIEVSCSKVESIVFYSNNVWCSDRVTTGGVDFASYEIKPDDTFVRIELVDCNGNMAWLSPFAVNV